MSDTMTTAVPFTSTQPAGFEWLDDEPTFDPERHLRLEGPTDVTTLADLGYSADEIAGSRHGSRRRLRFAY